MQPKRDVCSSEAGKAGTTVYGGAGCALPAYEEMPL